jgi:hypothetical protein
MLQPLWRLQEVVHGPGDDAVLVGPLQLGARQALFEDHTGAEAADLEA